MSSDQPTEPAIPGEHGEEQCPDDGDAVRRADNRPDDGTEPYAEDVDLEDGDPQ